jgi:hypothetical protein
MRRTTLPLAVVLLALLSPTAALAACKQDAAARSLLSQAWKAGAIDAAAHHRGLPNGRKLLAVIKAKHPQLTVTFGGRAGARHGAALTVFIDPASSPTKMFLWAKSASGHVLGLTATATGVPLFDGGC